MQSRAQRRALSYLASKIHPQLPLTPRESEQLLKLLTTSFRAQLDREHPVAPPKDNSSGRPSSSRQLVRVAAADNASQSLGPSSYSTATQHIDSILANPLFAVKPRRRASEPGSGGIHGVFRNPLAWFLNHVASGTADLSKAATCVAILKTSDAYDVSRKPAAQIAKWLQTSSLESSSEFIRFSAQRLLNPLVELLSKEGEMVHCWRWLKQSRASVDPDVIDFQSHLVRGMVGGSSGLNSNNANLNDAVAIFVKAHDVLCGYDYGTQRVAPTFRAPRKVLWRSGMPLVRRIMAEERPAITPDLYESFLESTKRWTLSRSESLQAILWLHHPAWPTAAPAIKFLRSDDAPASVSVVDDPAHKSKNATITDRNRRYLIHLCLEAARRCLAEKNHTDAQFALQFAKAHFPELSEGAQEQPRRTAIRRNSEERKRQREEDNMALLDQLLPT